MRDPTRLENILDLILTDLSKHYDKSIVSANLGTSDHSSDHWRPKTSRTTHVNKTQKHSVRRFPELSINAFGRWVSSHQWFTRPDSTSSINSMTESFNNDLNEAIDTFFPLKSVKLHPTDKPWMTSRIKQLILERQRAFHSDKDGKWRELRTKVRDEIAARKSAFYSEKVGHLKNTDPRKWWSLVNKLSGKCSGTSVISFEVDGKVFSGIELTDRLNDFFISVTSDIPALDFDTLPAFLPAPDELPTIRTSEVYKKLLSLSSYKACGPDAIPNQILKTFAFKLDEII